MKDIIGRFYSLFQPLFGEELSLNWWSPLLKKRKEIKPLDQLEEWKSQIDLCFENGDNKNDFRPRPRQEQIEYCIEEIGLKKENLIPIGDEEYEKIVFTLKEKVKREMFGEPDKYSRQDIHFWKEIVLSMKERIRDAYYIKDIPCQCANDRFLFFAYRSNEESWHNLAGREGYMLICPECLTILGYCWYALS